MNGTSPYLRGYGAASEYLGLDDPQGRTFRDWAEQVGLPFLQMGRVRVYRKADIDRAWERHATNLVGFTISQASELVAARG